MTKNENGKDTSRLAGGYIWLVTYATLNDEEAKAENGGDDVPTAAIAVKETFLREFIKEDYGDADDAVDRFLAEYTYDDLMDAAPMAILEGALAFEHRSGYDGTFLFPCPLDKDAVMAYTDYLSGLLAENGFGEASKYLDATVSL